MTVRLRTDAGCPITRHAKHRMDCRRITATAVDAALTYGREVPTRGAFVYAIGRKEVKLWLELGVDLSNYSGLQVVCSTDAVVLTAYRNKDFRMLRRNCGRGRRNPLRRFSNSN